MMDLVDERKVLICSTLLCEFVLYFHSHLSNKNRDDYTIGIKLNYNYNMLLVRSGHFQHKPIIKLINSLVENGIKIKRARLYKELLQNLFFEDILNSKAMAKVYEAERLYVSWDELISLFKLLSFALILSVCCLIIELLYYFKCFKYIFKKRF